MQQRGVELFKGGLFLERGDYSTYVAVPGRNRTLFRAYFNRVAVFEVL